MIIGPFNGFCRYGSVFLHTESLRMKANSTVYIAKQPICAKQKAKTLRGNLVERNWSHHMARCFAPFEVRRLLSTENAFLLTSVALRALAFS